MSRLPQCKPREVARVLVVLGFVLVRQKGSHAFFRNPKTGHTTVVPMHEGRDIDRSLLYGILREAGVSVDEFIQALSR